MIIANGGSVHRQRAFSAEVRYFNLRHMQPAFQQRPQGSAQAKSQGI